MSGLKAALLALLGASGWCVSLVATADNVNPNVSFRLEDGTNATEPYFPYLCNAGIKHAPYNNKVCHVISDASGQLPRGALVEWNLCENIAKNIQCECTSIGGNSHLDYMRYTTQNQGSAQQIRAAGGGFENGGTAFSKPPSGTNAFEHYKLFNNPLNTMYFELGSELFGAEYFLDVCYPPVGEGNFLPDPACTQSSGNAAANTVAYCSKVTSLAPTILPSRSGYYQTASGLTLQTTALTPSCSTATMPNPVSLSPTTNFSVWEQNWNQSKFDGCVIRYTFRETATEKNPDGTATSIPAERTWQLLPAAFKISGKVPDPIASPKGCTHTQGYWQNWSGCKVVKVDRAETIECGGMRYDPAWDKVTHLLQPGFPSPVESAKLQAAIAGAFGAGTLPLSGQAHALVPFLNSGLTWHGVLNSSVVGGTWWMNLAHQWIATTLNLAAGATFSLAGANETALRDSWLRGSTNLFNNTAYDNWESDKTTLDLFNNGVLGGGNYHCD